MAEGLNRDVFSISLIFLKVLGKIRIGLAEDDAQPVPHLVEVGSPSNRMSIKLYRSPVLLHEDLDGKAAIQPGLSDWPLVGDRPMGNL